ncbi:hypothetical protein H9Y05_15680 [Crocinitomicaceae bacterium CZZ-1]|uniref:Uncharacterized protein n=1 Tax=Taishania pollutisoli TaxID=2766479 RepID=A0A8J6PEM3_9FLAO|nr:hypothetical protein [Taishania pollutisoli]MBC9813917.1 hypothetical protein [Taishania pollutisoli]
MKITLTDLSKFVIIGRNEQNSMFYIRPKSDFIKEMEGKKTSPNYFVISTGNEGWTNESEIIKMIDDETKFYTYSYSENTFTDIEVVNEHIRTVKNDTTKDNIESLPIMS